jgi:hypothetical protein
MNPFEQLAMAWQAIARTLRRLGRAAPWAPFAILGTLQLGALALLMGFAHPSVSWFMVPFLVRQGGASLLHYPNLFRALPGLYGRIDLALGATLGAVVVGAATRVFANDFGRRRPAPRAAIGAAFGRALQLILASLPFNVLVFALSFGADWLMTSRRSAPLTRHVSDLTVLAGSIVLQSVFFYVVCEVMLAGRSALGALAAVPRAASRAFFAALAIGTLAALPLLPIQFLSSQSGLLVDRGKPELVGILMLLEIVIGLVLWFVLAGSSTLVYLTLVHRDDEVE